MRPPQVCNANSPAQGTQLHRETAVAKHLKFGDITFAAEVKFKVEDLGQMIRHCMLKPRFSAANQADMASS